MSAGAWGAVAFFAAAIVVAVGRLPVFRAGLSIALYVFAGALYVWSFMLPGPERQGFRAILARDLREIRRQLEARSPW